MFLLLGVMTYLFLYPNKFQVITIFSLSFEPTKIEIKNELLLVFIYAFTSYCHAVFMPLYSVLLTQEYTNKALYFWAIFWGVVDSCFEFLQLKTANATQQQEAIYAWFPDRFNRYFESGKFDLSDIIFIWLGVLSVFYLWGKIKEKTL
jgi:hypothetical protein